MPNNFALPKQTKARGSSTPGTSSSSLTNPSLSQPVSASILFVFSLCRVVAAFLSFYFLRTAISLPIYLFFVTFGASALLVAMQRPWKGRRLTTKRLHKVGATGVLLAATLFLWTVGLKAAGPLRTLLIDGAEIPLLYITAIVSRRQLPERAKTRGCIMMCLAYALVIWDASGRAPDIVEIEKSKFGKKAGLTFEHLKEKTQEEIDLIKGFTKKGEGAEGDAKKVVVRRRLLSLNINKESARSGPPERNFLISNSSLMNRSNFFIARRKLLSFEPEQKSSGSMIKDILQDGTALRSEVGVIFVLLASILMQTSRSYTRRLATDLGGSKRQFSLSVSAASLTMLPFALVSLLSSRAASLFSLSAGDVETSLHLSSVGGFALVGILWLTLPYYLRSLVSTTLKQKTLLQGGVIGPFIVAAIASVVFRYGDQAGGLSWILVTAFILDIVGLRIMLEGSGIRRNLSELPIDARDANGARAPSRR